LDGAISRSRRKQAGDSQEKASMNLESKKRRGDESGKQERRNFSDLFHGFVISRFVPVFLLS